MSFLSLEELQIAIHTSGLYHIFQTPKSVQRKKVHRLLETYFPQAPKQSLHIPSWPGDFTKQLYACPSCDTNNLLLHDDDYDRPRIGLSYEYGTLENNIDEAWVGSCVRCSHDIRFEPYFDKYDRVTWIQQQNAIGIGSCFLPTELLPFDLAPHPSIAILDTVHVFSFPENLAPAMSLFTRQS